MSDVKTTEPVVSTPTSSAEGEKPVVDTRTYTSDFVEKMKKEKENWRTKAMTLEDEKKKLEESELLRQQRFQEHSEIKTKEAKEWQEKYSKLQADLITSKKTIKVKEELAKLGAKPEHINELVRLVNYENIKYDTDTDAVYGFDVEARVLQEKLTPLFGSSGPRVDHGAPGGTVSKLTYDEWMKLPIKEKTKRLNEVMN